MLCDGSAIKLYVKCSAVLSRIERQMIHLLEIITLLWVTSIIDRLPKRVCWDFLASSLNRNKQEKKCNIRYLYSLIACNKALTETIALYRLQDSELFRLENFLCLVSLQYRESN